MELDMDKHSRGQFFASSDELTFFLLSLVAFGRN